jgi:transcription antitermination factor NusB
MLVALKQLHGLIFMMLDPHKNRELVFLFLFSFDMGQDVSSCDLVDLIKNECKVAKKYVVEAMARAESILKVRNECDAYISRVCTDYKIARIQNVERNILRLAIFELLLEGKIPKKVVFAEAKRLAKKFTTEEAATFVHALLAAVSASSGISIEGEVPNLLEAYQKIEAEVTSLEGLVMPCVKDCSL